MNTSHRNPRSLRGSLRNGLSWLRIDVAPGAAVILLAAAFILVAYRGYGSVGGFHRLFGDVLADHPLRPLLPFLYWYACSVVVLGLVPLLLARALLRLRPAELGLALGDWRFGLRAVLLMYGIMLPLLWLVSGSASFQNTYPLCHYVRQQAVLLVVGGQGALAAVLIHEVGYALYFLGWESLFRGFLTIGLARYIGPVAIFVQTIPFALLHAGKPPLEALGSIVAGVALGWLALRTRSMLWGCLIHVVVALSMDVLAVLARSAAAQ